MWAWQGGSVDHHDPLFRSEFPDQINDPARKLNIERLGTWDQVQYERMYVIIANVLYVRPLVRPFKAGARAVKLILN